MLSITPSYITTQKATNPKFAAELEQIKADIDKPLSAILTLNTIAHTVGAIGVGAQAGKQFGDGGFEVLGFQVNMESVIAVVMTLAILILSEIIPKTIGANKWKSLAPVTIKSLKFLMLILRPFVWLSQQITKGLKKDKGRSVLSRADFYALATNVGESGELNTQEFSTIKNILNLEKLKVEDIMTPRIVMKMTSVDNTLEEYYQRNPKLIYSRIPLYEGKEDNIVGLFLKDELLQSLLEGKQNEKLDAIKRPIFAVDRNLPLDKLLKEMVNGNHHLAIAQDQYGSLVGLVSLEDLFETIHGLEIVDEFDRVEDLQLYAQSIMKKKS